MELQSKVSRSHEGDTQKTVGLDPGFGSSNFGVCTELGDGIVNVVHAEEYPRPNFNEMINTTVRLLHKYNIRFDNSCRIFVDAANPSFVSTLKHAVNESFICFSSGTCSAESWLGVNSDRCRIFIRSLFRTAISAKTMKLTKSTFPVLSGLLR